MNSERFARIDEIDARLGDPVETSSPVSYAACAAWDEAEHCPPEGYAPVRALGLPRDFVPVSYGGTLRGYDVLLYAARALARRDLALAITTSAPIWSTLVWLGNDPSLARAHAASVLAGRAPCLAYSEQAHGADLLANETVARPASTGYVVTGRKWPINRASTSESVVLLARTGAGGDPRGQSLFWFEKTALDPGAIAHLPRVPTLGVRSCHISGLEFSEAFVPRSSRIGAEGAGLELALKGFHVTRTLCAGLSLGALDAAVRTTVRQASTRRLYGDTLLALAPVRRTLLDAYALLHALDAASLMAVRTLHVAPAQAATVSAVIKYAVPHLTEGAIARLATVHGARFYLRDAHDWGLMQRVYRDHLLVGIFDGSSPVNLHALGAQLALLARGARVGDARSRAAALERAALASRPELEPPVFDGTAIELMSRGQDDVLNSLTALREEIDAGAAPDALRDALGIQLGVLADELAALYAEVTAQRQGAARGSSAAPALARLAERYALLYVAGAAVHVWWRRAQSADQRVAPWLVLALDQLVGGGAHAGTRADPVRERAESALLGELLERSARSGCYALA